MEKINLYKQEPDLIDGLLAIVDSAKSILLNIKYSKYASEPTKKQVNLMNLFGIPLTAAASREQAQHLIDCKSQQILISILEKIKLEGGLDKM